MNRSWPVLKSQTHLSWLKSLDLSISQRLEFAHPHILTPSPSSLLHTLTPSHPHSLTYSLPHILTPSHPHSFSPSLPHILTPSLLLTLTPSHPHSLTSSLPHILTPSHPHTLTPSHPQCVDVQPNNGFGTLLPRETISVDVIFSASKPHDYCFDLTCLTAINRCG